MAAPITRLRYPSYRGKESEDLDSFIEEFEQIARANREAHNDDKLRIFPALLKGRGSRWVAALNPADLATWDTLKKAFLAEFRSLGFSKTVYNRLATLERRRKESIRISSDDDSGTSSDSSSEDEEITRRHKGKKKVKRRSSSADDSSSSEAEEKSKRVSSPKRRVKAGKSSMDVLLREMADLKVQIANVKEKRKNPSAPRHNLWCSNCHSNGHTKDDCKMAKRSGNQVN
ncbi:hypothetical protein R1sor_022419 [Riccia sorocarpa]|uniref:Retrotransposon gag domain-containing protein n=1 Tax=Riccia sorocarpa TaxID=122646 RepID=A0ABD3GKI2_9MARC